MSERPPYPSSWQIMRRSSHELVVRDLAESPSVLIGQGFKTRKEAEGWMVSYAAELSARKEAEAQS